MLANIFVNRLPTVFFLFSLFSYRFYARDPAGNNTIRENLYFDVSDGSGNVQPNQPLLMKVKPKIRVPPVVKVTSDVKV